MEICSGGVWGTVCDTLWGAADAQVVCRQLGYQSDGAVARTGAYFGQGTGPIQLSNAQCIGTEAFLQNCTHSTANSCTHGNDAGVTCPSKKVLCTCKISYCLAPYSQAFAKKAVCDWLEAQHTHKEGWKSVLDKCGALCVMICGEQVMRKWFAGSWDIVQ